MAGIEQRTFWDFAKMVLGRGDNGRTMASNQATFLRTDTDGTQWVRLAGSSDETPVNGRTLASAQAGDTVEWSIDDGVLSIVGNATEPSVGERKVTEVVRGAVGGLHERVREALDASEASERLAEAAQAVASAINQHFWTDASGIHVTEVTQDGWSDAEGTDYHSGANVLINALGQLFRDGLNNLLAIVAGTDPAVAIYDGEGNGSDNIVASFTKALIEIGRNSTDAVIKFCSGVGTIETDTSDPDYAGIRMGTEHTTHLYHGHAKAVIEATGAMAAVDGPMPSPEYIETGNPSIGLVAKTEVIDQPVPASDRGTTYDLYDLGHDAAYFRVGQSSTGTELQTFEWNGEEVTADVAQYENFVTMNLDTIQLSDDNYRTVEITHGNGELESRIRFDAYSEMTVECDTLNLDGDEVSYRDPYNAGNHLKLGSPTYYQNSGNYAITTAGVTTPTNGPRITIPAGSYVFVGAWTFNTGNSSGQRNLQLGFRSGASGDLWGERVRIMAAANNFAVLNVSALRTFSSKTTVYLAGSASITSGAGDAWITAVRLN